MGQNLVAILQLHTEHSTCQHGGDDTFEFNSFFLLLDLFFGWFRATLGWGRIALRTATRWAATWAIWP